MITFLVSLKPETNLQPPEQRMIVRYITRLVNKGLNIILFTNSVYIIKELNTLIMMKQNEKCIKDILIKYGYIDEELIDISKIKAYEFINGKFATINKGTDGIHGIWYENFDEYDEYSDGMNEIQSEIIFGC